MREIRDRLEGEAEGSRPAGAAPVRVYAAHLHVAGARPGGCERRVTVGEEYAAAAEAPPGTD